ncbi:hypothetical protein ACWEWI_27645 [Streptomyces sp. NPDC003753]
MSQQQYPQQQPGWNGPQEPGQPQPGWGGPQQPGMPPFQPQPPKKSNAGKIVGFGCLGVVALFVLIGIVAAVSGGDDSDKSNSATGSKPSAATSQTEKPAAAEASSKPKAKTDDKAAKTVVFKVWGTAPAGALGPLDITYGSDSDTRKGKFANGKFEATLPLNKDAMYFNVTAQLQGSGDIHCSVTIDGKTKQGHAAGGYNICDAQLSAGVFGGWEG